MHCTILKAGPSPLYYSRYIGLEESSKDISNVKRNIKSGILIKNHELKAITQTINGNILRSLLPLRKPTPKRRPILVRSHTGDFGGLKSFGPVWIQEWHFGHQTAREDGNHIPCFLPSALDHPFQFTQGIWPGGDPQYPGQFPNHDFCPGFQFRRLLPSP